MRFGIAGAGLLGRLLAHILSRLGHRVDVFDPAIHAGLDTPTHAAPYSSPRNTSHSQAAGWTAAGMLSPVAELERADTHVFALGLRSCALWPAVVQTLQQPVTLSLQGSLLLAHRSDAGAAQRIVGLLQAKSEDSYHPQALDRGQLATLEPAINGPALAWLLPCEGLIHPIQAMQALTHQATQQGVRWHWGQTVQHIAPRVLHTTTAATASQGMTAPEEAHHFDHVFDVRGVGAKPDVAVRGVRGEIFWLHAPGVQLHRPVRLMHPRYTVYLVPRPGDIVVVGASEIESEDLSPVSLRSTLELLSAAHSVVPALAEARIVHSESNLRPALPDNLPLCTQEVGLTRINGLFRHGWLLAPALVEQALKNPCVCLPNPPFSFT